MSLLKNKLQLLITLVTLGIIIWWASFQSIVVQQGPSVNIFGATYGLIALFGSIIGFLAVKRWGGAKTVLGRALLFFSLGLFAQEAGQLIYAYYIQVDKIQIPYPSWGDVPYFSSVLLYLIAALYLAKASGVKFSFKSKHIYKVVAVAVPAVMLIGSYLILLHGHKYDTSKPMTVFLDAGYPIVDACYISVALVAYLLSRKILGGVMKSGFLLVIAALFIQYIADFSFIYQSNRDTYISGGFVDLIYLIAYYMMSLAMLKFYLIYHSLKSKNQPAVAPKPSGVPAGT